MGLPLDHSVLEPDLVQKFGDDLGLDLSHDQQVEFLTRLDSFDIQAAPGCGKTTLVGLKLCILASGWNSSRQGVCVLTFTNTAKDQIRTLLAADSNGKKLLRSPHFVGTFQTFVDTFLTLPYLRSRGIDLRSMDDAYFANSALKLLSNHQFAVLNAYLTRRRNGLELIKTATYRYGAEGLETYAAAGDLPFGAGSQSGRLFIKFKKTLHDRGIFRYADMFALARQHLVEHPSLLESLRWRFPILLIDEMQDTRYLHEGLLEHIFDNPECIVQRIGDVNQRIFDDELIVGQEPTFPREEALSLPHSMRFGSIIASEASKVTIRRQQQIEGVPRVNDPPITLIVFDKDHVPAIFDRFAKVVVDVLTTEQIKKGPIKVLGARKDGTAAKFPKAITCYNPFFRSESQSSAKLDNFFREVARAQASEMSKGHRFDASDIIWTAVSEVLRRWEVSVDGHRSTRQRIRRFFDAESTAQATQLRCFLTGLLTLDLKDEASCLEAKQSLLDGLAVLTLTTPRPAHVDEFLTYDSTICVADVDAEQQGKHMTISASGIDVPMTFDTIQNSKGETHLATLILECFHDTFDLKEVLPAFIGKQPEARKALVSVKKSSQLIFVGMTRPKELLCFAALKDHVPDLNEFRTAGWRVEDVTL